MVRYNSIPALSACRYLYVLYPRKSNPRILYTAVYSNYLGTSYTLNVCSTVMIDGEYSSTVRAVVSVHHDKFNIVNGRRNLKVSTVEYPDDMRWPVLVPAPILENKRGNVQTSSESIALALSLGQHVIITGWCRTHRGLPIPKVAQRRLPCHTPGRRLRMQ
jgi:hypothetical protein